MSTNSTVCAACDRAKKNEVQWKYAAGPRAITFNGGDLWDEQHIDGWYDGFRIGFSVGSHFMASRSSIDHYIDLDRLFGPGNIDVRYQEVQSIDFKDLLRDLPNEGSGEGSAEPRP